MEKVDSVKVRNAVVLVLALSMSAGVFAGCLGQGTESGDVGSGVDAGEVLNPNLQGADLENEVKRTLAISALTETTAPTWTVGEYWTFDVMFADSGDERITFTGVVYDDAGSDYLVATENRNVAGFEAIFDIPLLGPFSKETLGTTNGFEPIELYQWPLVGDKSWTGDYDADLDGTSETYTFHVAFEKTISTPEGTLPGYTIHGLNDVGEVLFSYDYVPALHFANHIFFFDPEAPGDMERAQLHIMVTDHGYDWTGDLVVAQGEMLVMDDRFMVLDNGGGPGEPVVTFDVAEGFDVLLGWFYSWACDGAGVFELVSPSNQRYESTTVHAGVPRPTAVEPANPFSVFNAFQDCSAAGTFGAPIPAEAGTWKLVMNGVGFAGAGAGLWAIAETVIPMA